MEAYEIIINEKLAALHPQQNRHQVWAGNDSPNKIICFSSEKVCESVASVK